MSIWVSWWDNKAIKISYTVKLYVHIHIQNTHQILDNLLGWKHTRDYTQAVIGYRPHITGNLGKILALVDWIQLSKHKRSAYPLRINCYGCNCIRVDMKWSIFSLSVNTHTYKLPWQQPHWVYVCRLTWLGICHNIWYFQMCS